MFSLLRLLTNSRGAATIELALVLALVVIAILGSVASLGGGVVESLDTTAQQVAGASV